MKNIDVNKSIALYKEGFSLYDIGKEFNVSNNLIKRRLLKAGIKLRSASETNKLANLHHPKPYYHEYIDKTGYIRIRLPPNHLFASMRNIKGYVPEHRLVMAQYLGRPLKSYEIVHHIDRNKQNNNINNLKLIKSTEEHLLGEGHISDVMLKKYVEKLKRKNIALKKEIEILKSKLGVS